jgi:hypothetical protein
MHRSYLESGRWQVTSAGNTVPMSLISKPGTDQLRTAVDLRARNENTVKKTSPLPDMESILRRVSGRRYQSILDEQNAYGRIRVVVPRTAMTTPDGNMVSNMIQIVDCNAPSATYQASMNQLFRTYIRKWMDVYFDDTIIYSGTLKEQCRAR